VLPPVEQKRRAGSRVYAVEPGRPNLQMLEGGKPDTKLYQAPRAAT
jgi:hypothetical protein